METQDISSWLEHRRRTCDMSVEEIPWQSSREWKLDVSRLRHRTGGFFSIAGYAVQTDEQIRFSQPLIVQPEIGILGFLLRKDRGYSEILVQAKPEPGNVHLVQAAPSVQATESNYRRVHGGESTPYIEYFLGGMPVVTHSDSLQSEQGTRFLGKYNRNMLVEVTGQPDSPPVSSLYWAPVDRILGLLREDFMVNTDARSVLVSSPWTVLTSGGEPFGRGRDTDGLEHDLWKSWSAPEDRTVLTDEEIERRLMKKRRTDPFEVREVGLDFDRDWVQGQKPYLSDPGDRYRVRQFNVRTTEREVEHWDQPLVASTREGACILFGRSFNGILHFLFRPRAEIGFRECYQFGPSIQTEDGGPDLDEDGARLDRLLEGAQAAARTVISCRQSDEGGRFYRSVSEYSIAVLDEDTEIPADDSLVWMSLGQIERFASKTGFMSNEARSLVSLFLSFL